MVSSKTVIAALVVGILMSAMVMADPPSSPGSDASGLSLPEPQPLVPGARVVTLWPKGSPRLRALPGYDRPEVFNMSKGNSPRLISVVNIHNPSIEVHLAPSDKAIGAAVIVAAGG